MPAADKELNYTQNMETTPPSTPTENSGLAPAPCSPADLIEWATRQIEQWENHDRYRVTEADRIWHEEHGEPKSVWIARGVLRSQANAKSEGSPPSRLENKQERNGDSLH